MASEGGGLWPPRQAHHHCANQLFSAKGNDKYTQQIEISA